MPLISCEKSIVQRRLRDAGIALSFQAGNHFSVTNASSCFLKHLKTHIKPVKKVILRLLVLHEELQVLEDPLFHWDGILVAD